MIPPAGEAVKGYTVGTHRAVPPEVTLARIRPLLERLGVTRCADLTGLDCLGIPVTCAVRPRGHILQTTNGKGLRPVDAQVSALMEALEHFHAEEPDGRLRRASAAALAAAGEAAVSPADLPGYKEGTYFAPEFQLDWLRAEDLLAGAPVWLPASVAQIGVTPMLHAFTANGLASGNTLAEATLHALCEVVERHAVSSLSVDGRVRLAPPGCRSLDLEHLDDGPVAALHEKLVRAGVKLVLIAVASGLPTHTFWAVLLDPRPFSLTSTVNFGYGSHPSPSVAAARAITEAAQSRLTYIHGAREDLAVKIAAQTSTVLRSLYDAFDRLRPDLAWADLTPLDSPDFAVDCEALLGGLRSAGYAHAYRIDLTREPFGVPVVKVVVPGLRHNRRLF